MLHRHPPDAPRVVSAALAVLALVACAPAPATGAPPVLVDTTWYVSARAREEGRDTRRLADSLEFGLVVTARKNEGDPAHGSLSNSLVDSVQLSAPEFTARLRQRLHTSASPDAAALLYVHGFGTSLREAWEHAVQAGIRSRAGGPWIVFGWPSNGLGLDWPRNGELYVRAYRDDSVMAGESRAHFARAAHHVLDAVGSDDLLLLTHSMGAQVAGEALVADSTLRARLTADPLRALMFFAPDVSVERFTGHIVPAVRPLAQRLVLYASSNDRLLTISRRANNAERAGLIYGAAGRLLSLEGVESVDVTRGVAAENWWQRNLGSHHSLRRSSAALFDIVQVVGGRHPASCREVLGTATPVANGSWKLTSIRTPDPASLGRCAR